MCHSLRSTALDAIIKRNLLLPARIYEEILQSERLAECLHDSLETWSWILLSSSSSLAFCFRSALSL